MPRLEWKPTREIPLLHSACLFELGVCEVSHARLSRVHFYCYLNFGDGVETMKQSLHKMSNAILIDLAVLFLLVGSFIIAPSYATLRMNTISTTAAHIRILPAPDNETEGHYGQSIATGPGNIIVVGAGNESANGYVGAGKVYTFHTNVGILNYTFVSPNAQRYGDFGQSVAISAGGKRHYAYSSSVVVGAPNETVEGNMGAGHAYVFNTTTSALTNTLTSPNSQYDGEFGWSVTASGSIVVIGAPNETVNGIAGAGHAYVFDGVTGILLETLTSPHPRANGYFGLSVGMSDNNVENTTTVIVGAPGETSNGFAGSGRAYVFNTTTGKLTHTIDSPNAQSGGHFGFSVSLSVDLVAIGAPGESSNGNSSAGNAYIFRTKGTLLFILSSPNSQLGGSFGSSVWISEQTVGVGAPNETANGLAHAGNAYAFSDRTGSLIKLYDSPNSQTNGFFGYSITVVQGPEYPAYIVGVGAPNENVSGYAASGNAYV